MSVEFALIRIDDRLMHGQVAVGWTKAIHPDHIIIANNEAYNDPVQKMLIEMASPPQYGITICEVEQLTKVCHQAELENSRLLILFATVTDVVKAVEQGLPITNINVGGMRYSAGKKQIMKAVAIDQADINQFKVLINKGIEIDIQMVPTDEQVSIKGYL